MQHESYESLLENLIPQAEQRKLDTEFKGAKAEIVNLSRGAALFGLALGALLVAELLTVPFISRLVAWHIVIGVVIVPLLAGKIVYSSLRFLRYYRGDLDYVRAGAPWFPLRVLSPFLVVTTVLVVASGIELAIAGPTSFSGTFLAPAHFLLSAVWFLLVVFHAIAYARRSAYSSLQDIRHRIRLPRGESSRLRVVALALTILIGAAIATQFSASIKKWENAFTSPGATNPSELYRQPVQYYNPASLKRGRQRQKIHQEQGARLQRSAS